MTNAGAEFKAEKHPTGEGVAEAVRLINKLFAEVEKARQAADEARKEAHEAKSAALEVKTLKLEERRDRASRWIGIRDAVSRAWGVLRVDMDKLFGVEKGGG